MKFTEKLKKPMNNKPYKPNPNIKLICSTNKSLVPVIHSGLAGCFEIAFYLTKKVKKGDVFVPGDIKMTDGYMPSKEGERIYCSNCCQQLDGIMSSHSGEYEVI